MNTLEHCHSTPKQILGKWKFCKEFYSRTQESEKCTGDKKRHDTLCKCKSNFILVRGECLCNTFLKKCVSGMTVFGYIKQVRTATIQVTFCSLVEQDETHSTPPNTHSCSPKLPLCCFGKGWGGVGWWWGQECMCSKRQRTFQSFPLNVSRTLGSSAA